MKITALQTQRQDPDRVNIFIDGKYRFSLEIAQVVELGIKVGENYDDSAIGQMEQEGQFSRLYAQALEYCLMRPHSSREIRDYLYRKTLTKNVRSRRTGELKVRTGVNRSIADRVFERLVDRGYIDDNKFSRYWIENRRTKQGISSRKLQAELLAKGVGREIIDANLAASVRSDRDELRKMIVKKHSRYQDQQKFIRYLSSQGFAYDEVRSALDEISRN